MLLAVLFLRIFSYVIWACLTIFIVMALRGQYAQNELLIGSSSRVWNLPSHFFPTSKLGLDWVIFQQSNNRGDLLQRVARFAELKKKKKKRRRGLILSLSRSLEREPTNHLWPSNFSLMQNAHTLPFHRVVGLVSLHECNWWTTWEPAPVTLDSRETSRLCSHGSQRPQKGHCHLLSACRAAPAVQIIPWFSVQILQTAVFCFLKRSSSVSLLFDFVSLLGANWLFSVPSFSCQTTSVTSTVMSFFLGFPVD